MAHEDDEDVGEDEGGLSTPKKVVAGAALGVAVPAAVGVARKLLSNDDDASSEPMSRERRSSSSRSRSKSTSRPKAKAKAKAKTATSRSRSTTKRATTTARRTVNRTREQLYKQATRLKIEGRSSMNKTQLERAIARAKAKAK